MNIEFAWPWLLVFMPLWLLIFILPVMKRKRAAIYFPFLAQVVDRHKTMKSTILWWRAGQFLVWALLCVALARPQMVGEALPDTRLARNLVLALDISESMATRDMVVGNSRVNRLDAAKVVLRDFIKRRSGDQIGLVLFGSNAYIQSPLTFDSSTVQALLDETEIGIAGQKTAIGDSLLLSVKLIENTESAATDNSSIILLSDGSNTSGKVSPSAASNLARESGLRVYTIGFGGNRFRQEVDERTLTSIARNTGGRYFRAQNTSELVAIYDQLDKLNQTETRQQSYRPLQEIYYVPLFLALALASLFLLLRMCLPVISHVPIFRRRL